MPDICRRTAISSFPTAPRKSGISGSLQAQNRSNALFFPNNALFLQLVSS